MLGDTHSAIGGAAFLGSCALTPILSPGAAEVTAGIAFCGWVIASVAALGPDIDSKGSIISQLFGYPSKGLSFVIRKFFGGHRKITHSLVGFGIIAVLLYGAVMVGLPKWVAMAIGIGWASHVIADSITTMGCIWFWPLDMHHYGLPLVKTGTSREYNIIVPLAGFATLVFALMLLAGK